VQAAHIIVERGVGHGEAVRAEHLGAAAPAHRLVGRVDVDDAELGVAQHQRVGGGVEDRAVLRLALAQALLVVAPLHLGARAHGEDLQHRLDQVLVDERLLRHDGDDPGAAPFAVLQGEAGIADRPHLRQQLVARILARHVARHHRERAVHHVIARRALERVLEVLAVGAAAEYAEGLDGARRPVGEPADQRELHVQDDGEVAGQLLEHGVALRARHCQRGGLQRLLAPAALGDVGAEADHRLRPAVGAGQGELEVHDGAPARAVHGDRLDHHAVAALDHLAVGVAERAGDLRRQDLVHGAAEDLRRALADQLLEGEVDVQVAALEVAREHHHRRLVEDGLEPLPAEIHAAQCIELPVFRQPITGLKQTRYGMKM
jgi:hypothetical protein